ncbi:hypothetical protein PROFUN_07852 [Planoprotostelium fungivorum]|uniref:Uncharacterized protein n=1 Tax=Planoprotostelium fungivorum TaxID=1890364 RepID=A0A2P6NLA9_9EUKA|nr:hypothetical protein PROFUN_07852 [Planoprotostelium fungivorum]
MSTMTNKFDGQYDTGAEIPKYRVARSLSNRAKCKECRECFVKGELRVEMTVPPNDRRRWPLCLMWHLRCFRSFGHICEPQDFGGYDMLDMGERIQVEKMFDGRLQREVENNKKSLKRSANLMLNWLNSPNKKKQLGSVKPNTPSLSDPNRTITIRTDPQLNSRNRRCAVGSPDDTGPEAGTLKPRSLCDISITATLNMITVRKYQQTKVNYIAVVLQVKTEMALSLKRLIHHHVDINATDTYGSTALHWATLHNRLDAVRFLLQVPNCSPGATDFVGRTPTFYASKIGSQAMLRLLIDAGIDVTVSPQNRETPLMKASQGGHLECVQMLMSERSFETRGDLLKYVNQVDVHELTALHHASLKGHARCCSNLIRLLQNGADHSLKNSHGETALHLSVLYHRPECARLLVDSGATVETRNNSGKTPLDDAAYDRELASYLRETFMSQQLEILKQKDLDAWTPAEVARWLGLSGFGQYRDIFLNNSVAGTSLQTLTLSSLKTELNVASYGHRTAMIEKIKRLKREIEDRKAMSRSNALRASGQTSSVAVGCNLIEYSSLQMQELLGKGFFGEVKRAIWKGAEVAVKVLYRVESEEVFFRELSIINKLRHPNIIMFMGASLDGENRCIVTEYLSGGNVHRLIHHDWNVLEKVSSLRHRIALDVVKGLTYLHDLKIVHRDLTPKNLLLDVNYNCKVCDFGLSRIKEDSGALTMSLGCLPYQAPEVFRGDKYNEKADVYSFGMVLYEMLSGVEPHRGHEAMKFANMVSFDGYRPSLPEISEQWNGMIERCWDTIPDQRPSFRDLLQELCVTEPQRLMESSSPNWDSMDYDMSYTE